MRVFVETGRDVRTGKRRRTSKTIRGTKKQAADVLAAMLAEYGDADRAHSMTLDAFWNEIYMPRCAERLRPVTVEGYRRKYALFIEQPLGSYALQRITPAVVDTWLGAIEGCHRKLQAYKTLRQVLNKATRLNIIKRNPCQNVEVPKVPRYTPEVLDAHDAAAYIEHFRGSSVEAGVLVAIGGGLRRSEICALDWGDIQGGKVAVKAAITCVNGTPHKDLPKSEFGTRVVTLPPSIAARLEELREDDGVPLLVNAKGGRLHPDRLTHGYLERRDTLPEGVKRVTLKNLRHTSLTLALEGGADLLAVSRRAGHSTSTITAHYYLRPHESVDEAAAAGLDELLKG